MAVGYHEESCYAVQEAAVLHLVGSVLDVRSHIVGLGIVRYLGILSLAGYDALSLIAYPLLVGYDALLLIASRPSRDTDCRCAGIHCC